MRRFAAKIHYAQVNQVPSPNSHLLTVGKCHTSHDTIKADAYGRKAPHLYVDASLSTGFVYFTTLDTKVTIIRKCVN